MGNAVLGIHSNASGGDDLTAGHAWLTITTGGSTEYYGLWPDDHPNVLDNGPKSDIRVGLEAGSRAAASRYYQLSDAQYKNFKALLKSNVTWRYSHNCSSWASETVNSVIGEDVDADDWAGIETPRELGRNILLLEAADPTSNASPKQVKNAPRSSSW